MVRLLARLTFAGQQLFGYGTGELVQHVSGVGHPQAPPTASAGFASILKLLPDELNALHHPARSAFQGIQCSARCV